MGEKKRGNSAGSTTRKQTDKNLRAERAKTDESLSELRRSKEVEADASVSRSREPTSADETPTAQRRRLDETVDVQRAQPGEQAQALFRKERALTDRSLASERTSIDAEVARAAAFLAKAVGEGESTRGALAEREAFLSVMSHHLKRPLLAIAVAGEELKSDVQRTGTARQMDRQLDSIVLNAQEVLRVIGDLTERLARWQAEPRDTGERRPSKSRAALQSGTKPKATSEGKAKKANRKR